MASHTEQTPQKENATVFIIVVLMFIIIAPVLGAIGKSSSCSKDCEKTDGKGNTEQHDAHHGESESHEEHHGGH